MTKKLETCPCCGHTANFQYKVVSAGISDNWTRVQCTECGIKSRWYLTKKDAILAWNKRVKAG